MRKNNGLFNIQMVTYTTPRIAFITFKRFLQLGLETIWYIYTKNKQDGSVVSDSFNLQIYSSETALPGRLRMHLCGYIRILFHSRGYQNSSRGPRRWSDTRVSRARSYTTDICLFSNTRMHSGSTVSSYWTLLSHDLSSVFQELKDLCFVKTRKFSRWYLVRTPLQFQILI